MTGERRAARALGVIFIAIAAGACAYDFDGLIAPTGAGGAAGTSGVGGTAGANAGDAAGPGGTAGTGGAAGNSGKGGADGGSGKAGSSADAATDRGTPDVLADGSFDCAAVNGAVFQGHCYYPSTVTTSWTNASSTGCGTPSHLVTISSASEQNVAAGILPGQERWIGMRRAAGAPDMESSFKWVTNEALSFRSWEVYDSGAPEPNFNGDCVRMRTTNNWADAPCNDNRPAICERE